MESELVVPDDFQKFCSLLPRKALVSLSMHDLREIWGISKQREHKAWDSGQESVLLYPKDKRPTFEQWQASKGEK